MGYYMGDFYGVGGYYRGDPFWGSLFSLVSKGVGLVKHGLFSGGGITKSAVPPMPGGARDIMQRAASGVMEAGATARRAIIKHPVLSAAGAAGALGAAGLAAHARRGAAPAVGVGGGFRRHRRMNPCNRKALHRAIRRAHAFERLARRVIGFSSPRKAKGHMYFKRRRKAR